jgi:hypothetical protein
LSGFLVLSFADQVIPSSATKLVDLGGSDVKESVEIGNVRAAWAHWQNSQQWRVSRSPQRLVLIEGQPDRYPAPGESIIDWLDGRSGSFRGFEIAKDPQSGPAKLRVFTDPLGTRPVYVLISADRVCISDKLATVVLNSPSRDEPDWGGLLEGAVLGTIYSRKTTVKGAALMAPGEALEFEGRTLLRSWRNALPKDSSLTAAKVAADPAGTLRFAIGKAIRETWTDLDTRLLLSGGLDSRIVLALATGRRKALTLELYSSEAEITKQVAEAAGADLEMVPAPDYEYVLRWAYLVTGAAHDSRFVTHLGLLQDWRKQGICSVTHGYFHNTMYRGWTAAPLVRYPNRSSILFDWMGRNALYFEKYGCRPAALPCQFYELLSSDGKNVLRRELRELSDSVVPVIVDGYDLTFERRLLEFVSRQIYFCCLFGWYEGLDVVSPVFQPAIWTWYALSHPRHRHHDWAIRETFLSLDHPAARLPDSNTLQPIAHLKTDWRDRVRNQFWYPPLRAMYQKTFHKPQPYEEGGMHWGARFREPRVFAALADGAAVLLDNPLFDRTRVQAALDAYRAGDNQLVDAICALMKLGQWERLLAHPESQIEHVHVFESQVARNATSLAAARAK